jgi:beta-lactamase class A
MRFKIISLITLASLAANIVLGYKLFKKPSGVPSPQTQYPYLSKRIFTASPNDIIINFIPLRTALRDYAEHQAGNLGIYFEYLPSGTSIGVNDREEVQLASLSKVPLVMSIFKKIEKGQISLQDNLTMKREHMDQRFGTLWQKGEGTRLRVEELVKSSLQESDNTAYNMLFNALSQEEINEVYENLDIQVTEQGDSQTVSPKSYSSIFRSLYLSSFLTEENSNRILDILTTTTFSGKLTAGVPDNIRVAHKIGVFERLDTSQSIFIDCGIVYVPNRPYIVCAFVQGTDEEAQNHISHISKMIYGYIVKVKGGR